MYIFTNTNKVTIYITVSYQGSLYVKNKTAAKEKKSKILKKPLGIRENLSIGINSACDR